MTGDPITVQPVHGFTGWQALLLLALGVFVGWLIRRAVDEGRHLDALADPAPRAGDRWPLGQVVAVEPIHGVPYGRPIEPGTAGTLVGVDVEMSPWPFQVRFPLPGGGEWLVWCQASEVRLDEAAKASLIGVTR